MGATFIQIRNLSVRYVPETGQAVRAVDSIDLDLRKGQVVAVLGESGSGKSTLASSLVRLLPTNVEVAGSILFEGDDLLTTSERTLRKIRGARIALIPQDPAVSLNPVIRVGEQISEVLRAHLSLSSQERRERAGELLREVGFEEVERIYSSYPHQLSGGQRQRIAIAQAIACRPDLIIADEPTSKLDAELQSQIVGLMSQLVGHHGTALLWITHDPTILPDFAERIVVMYAGKIIEDGPADALLRNSSHPYSRALIRLAHHHGEVFFADRGPERQHLPEIPGEPTNVTQIATGCCFEPRCADKQQVCSTRHPQAFSLDPSHIVSCFKYGD